ncbi:MAG: putative b-mannanase, glycoside hydrolase family 26 protein, partial [Fibrobacterota bacterium]
DATKAIQPGTTENALIIRDIDSIATQLKRLQAAKVPVLWRPLHEAGGAWFWWGAKGATTCKALYDILFERLTNHHGLHNLIWVWSTPESDWYPGNSKVDIIGYDSYPGGFEYGSQKTMFDQLFALVQGKKMVAMSENGPIPDIDACMAEDAKWSYFSTWDNLAATQNTAAHLRDAYSNVSVTTLDEVNYATSAIRRSNGRSAAKEVMGNSLSFRCMAFGEHSWDLLGRLPSLQK